MDYENLKNKLEVRGNKLTATVIDLFESWRGYKFPKDFVEFTLKYPGAYLEGSFDAEDRPGASINQFLKFEKNEYYSIYIESLYEFSDFGPYVLFACDAGGNYLAFDYSKDKLNPSVVFIEHEELGIIEFPDGKSEHDFTEEELDRMMNSEKLEDFPCAIHFVADSFTNFIDLLTVEEEDKYKLSDVECIEADILEIETLFNISIDNSIKSLFKKYGGAILFAKKLDFIEGDYLVNCILNPNKNDDLSLLKFIELRGGIKRFEQVLPFIIGRIDNDEYEKVIFTIYQHENTKKIVIIPESNFQSNSQIDFNNLKVISEDIEHFTSNLIKLIEK
ncbi:SMI1/KNR4 family protein [Macrococcoides canis]|uniref:SMI1/KNR4 family protein n=1 Tax=Macrococcoides canis TaxID=1855823 RepID=UPI0020B6F1D1|nr:SMI1/KNR4 family protein [Macrococcus canis]UTH01517.1 SMI1/KNR4 family protein [Macrococcus canis]